MIDPAAWRSNIEAEVDALFHCVQHALPHMREARFGRIIAVGMAGADYPSGPPHDYMTGKAARNSFMRSIAKSEIAHGITCNVVAPGHIARTTFKQAVDAVKHGTQWSRRTHAYPQDAAEIIKFLCSDAAAYVTGSVIELAGVAS